jgi:hypothetical protein
MTAGIATGKETVTCAADAVNYKIAAKPTTVQILGDVTITVTLIDAQGRNAIMAPSEAWDWDFGVARGVLSTIDADCSSAPLFVTTCVGVVDFDGADGIRSFEIMYTAPGTVPPGGLDILQADATRFPPLLPDIDLQQLNVEIRVTDVPANLVMTPAATTGPGDGATPIKVDMKLTDAAGATIVFDPGVPVTVSVDNGATTTDANGVALNVLTTDAATGLATVYIRPPLVGENGTAVNVTLTAVAEGVANSIVVTFTPAAAAAVYFANIEAARNTDLAGTVITSAARNQRILVEVTVKNTSPSAKTLVVAVQCFDAANVALTPQFTIFIDVPGGATVKYLAGIQLPNAAGTVTCEVNVYLSVLPAAGGEVTAPKQSTSINVT